MAPADTTGPPTMRNSVGILAFALAAPLMAGCGGGGGMGAGPGPGSSPPPTAAPSYVVEAAPVSFTALADSIAPDPEMEGLISPFRDRMAERIDEVAGEAAGPLAKGWPEGTLGNFAADALLRAAQSRVGEPIQMALMNNGGLRVPIAQGPITVGKMFELMPFENMVSILVLTGEQVEALAQTIARRRGEPIAGWSFRIVTEGGDRVARDVRVGGEPLNPAGRYRLATNDYLANGGDDMAILLRAVERRDLPFLVRDAFIQIVREDRIVRPRLDGRIAGGGRP